MGRRPRSSPSGREARAWRRGPACKQPTDWNAGRTLVNTDEPDDALSKAERRVLEIQTKLHRWASDDPHRRFDDLYNLVCDPAFLLVAWDRVRGNKGARTAGVDGQTAYYIQAVRGLEGFLTQLRDDLKARCFQPLPARRRAIPKAGGKVRYLGIATIRDRVVQAACKLVLEPILEVDFLPCSYGFRSNRRAQDAVAEVHHFASRSYEWIVEGDIKACFDEISHPALVERVRQRVGDKRVLALVKAFLKAGILTEDGTLAETDAGTPQGSITTPPTQWITRAVVPVRVGLGVGVGAAGVGAAVGGDAVPDGDLLGSDEDVFDEQAEHALAFFGGGGVGLVAQLGEEAVEVVGEFEVELTVGGLGVERLDLAAQTGFAGAQVGHAVTELVDGEQLFGECLDHVRDRLGGLDECEFEPFALFDRGIGGAGGVEAFVDLGADQVRVGEQAGDVLPDDMVEVVGADWLVGTDPAAFVAVVVAAQAPVVEDLLVGGAGRGPVVAVAAARAGGQALQQGRDFGVAGGEALVVGQPLRDPLERLGGDDGWHGNLGPLLARPVDRLGRPRCFPALEAGPAVQPGRGVHDHGLAEDRPTAVGGVAPHPQTTDRS